MTVRDDLVLLPARRIRDQKDVNCCVSCAIGTCIEAAQPVSPELAPLYHFHFAGGVAALRLGLQLTSARAALLSSGICSFARHRFDIDAVNVGRTPDAEAQRDGRARRPIDRARGELLWQNVPLSNTPGQWRRRLRAKIPLVAVFSPNPSYRNDAARGGRLRNIAGPYEAIRHAVAVIGYSDSESAFLIQDSRGSGFGLEGQWWLPYDLAEAPFLDSAFCFAE